MTPNLEIASGMSRFSSVAAILHERARQSPDRVAYTFITDRGRSSQAISYADLEQEVMRIGALIWSATQRQEVVACVLAPGRDLLASFLACLWTGRIGLLMPPPRKEADFDHLTSVIRHSGAKLCLTTEAHELLLKSRVDDRLVRIVATTSAAPREGALLAPVASQGDVAFLQYTSGSTGRPKGVAISHANLLDNSARICSSFGHTAESVGVIWLPPYHDMGLIGGLVQPLFAGFPVHLLKPEDFLRNPALWLETISKVRATTSGGPNFAYETCVRRVGPDATATLDLSSWRVAFTGAEPVSVETIDRFAAKFEPAGFRRHSFLPCYGMAETTLMTTAAGLEAQPRTNRRATSAGEREFVSCGKPVAGHDVRIVDPETGEAVPEGGIGEIWIAGPSVAAGYWHNGEADPTQFGDLIQDELEPKFFRSGDLGYFHERELYVCGRRKAVLIVRGVNHSLEHLEVAAENAVAHIVDARAVAFGTTVGEAEELAIVLEVRRRDYRPDMTESLVERVREAVNGRHGVNPVQVLILPAAVIPRTSSGKIRRHECTIERFASGPGPGPGLAVAAASIV